MYRAAIVSACLVVGGCASAGTKIDEQKVGQLQIGKTTCTQAIQSLGPPQADTRSARGDRTVQYVYSDARSRPENFIPYVGLFVGGYDTDSQGLTIKCDKRDIVQDYEMTKGSMDINQNLSR